MKNINASSGIYLKFLNLVRALDRAPVFPALDANEERLLNQLAAVWQGEKRVTVVEAMNMATDMSPTTVHRRLKTLKKKGIIDLSIDKDDNRVKYVVPTATTNAYFTQLSNCLLAAAKGR
jgi:DNA-binding transcriptional ArsR family regulator